jgi:broad specificity phosphatase PhoE
MQGGGSDIPLNENGLHQAKLLGEQLKETKFDAIYSSPMKRAMQTAESIKKRAEITIDERLIERYYGDFEGKGRADVDNISALRADMWNTRRNMEFGGIEKVLDFEKRIFDFYDDVLAKHPDGNILIIAHGGVVRASKGYFLGRPKDGDYINAHGRVGTGTITKFERHKKVD